MVALLWIYLLTLCLAGCGDNPEPAARTGWWPRENQAIRYRVRFDEMATSTSDPDSPDEGSYDYSVSISREDAEHVRISVKCEKMVIDGRTPSTQHLVQRGQRLKQKRNIGGIFLDPTGRRPELQAVELGPPRRGVLLLSK